MTATERTGWRDQRFSAMHRELGVNVPLTDIDTVWIEYDQAKPVALVDYKLHTVDVDALLAAGDVNLRVIGELGDRAMVPAFCIRYWDAGDYRDWRFKAYPLNWLAEWFIGQASQVLAFDGYAGLLYRLRNRPTPEAIQQRAASRTRRPA
ncbi:MAG: hypothetical protein L0Y54_15880 [Sporichthyaceae bacterium]|nr:hypothetical protein [Sporichthyaceae bacterium]